MTGAQTDDKLVIRNSLFSLSSDEMSPGHAFTDEDIYGESTASREAAEKAREHDEREARIAFRVGQVNWLMENESYWDRDVVNLFEKMSPANRVILQRRLDMEKLIDEMNDFEATRLGTLGPVTAGQEKLNQKRAAYIKQVIDDYLPVAPDRAEVFVLFALTGVYDNDAYAIFAELANQGVIFKLLAMPNVAKQIKARGLQTFGFDEPGKSWTRIFPSMALGFKRWLKDDRKSSYAWQKGQLPAEYQSILWQMEMGEYESSLTVKNTIIRAIDEVTFGVPHGVVDVGRNTVSAISDIAHGEYEQAGEKLVGVATILVTHLGVKAVSTVAGKIGGMGAAVPGEMSLAGFEGPITAEEASLGRIFPLNTEAQAAMGRLLTRVGRGGVEKAAAFVQADSQAALFVIEHGEAGIYALLEAEGDVATAATKLPSRQLAGTSEPEPAVPQEPPKPAVPDTPPKAALKPYVNDNPGATVSETENGAFLDSKAQAGELKGVSRVRGAPEKKGKNQPGTKGKNRSADYRFEKPDGTEISVDLAEPETVNTSSIVTSIIKKSGQATIVVVKLGKGISGQLSIEQLTTIAHDVLRTPGHDIARVIVRKDDVILLDLP